MKVQNREEFMEQINNLLSEAQALEKTKADIVTRTNELFDENSGLAYQMGLDDMISYNDNPAHELQDLTQNFTNTLWLPSSWERC